MSSGMVATVQQRVPVLHVLPQSSVASPLPLHHRRSVAPCRLAARKLVSFVTLQALTSAELSCLI